jgi:hypothetical protein
VLPNQQPASSKQQRRSGIRVPSSEGEILPADDCRILDILIKTLSKRQNLNILAVPLEMF